MTAEQTIIFEAYGRIAAEYNANNQTTFSDSQVAGITVLFSVMSYLNRYTKENTTQKTSA